MPKAKGKIVTLIGAMSMAGVIASLTYKGGTTKESFLFFIQTILLPALWKGTVMVEVIGYFIEVDARTALI